MTAQGDVVLLEMRTVGSTTVKLRPALVLAHLPGAWQTWLACGISTQLGDVLPGWDEVVDPGEGRFQAMGLKRRSVIRLSFLASVGDTDIRGRIGVVPRSDLARLRRRLAANLA
jgi:mRNA interferase MazF